MNAALSHNQMVSWTFFGFLCYMFSGRQWQGCWIFGINMKWFQVKECWNSACIKFHCIVFNSSSLFNIWIQSFYCQATATGNRSHGEIKIAIPRNRFQAWVIEKGLMKNQMRWRYKIFIWLFMSMNIRL